MFARREAALLAPSDPDHARIAELDKRDAERHARQEAEFQARIRNRGINITRVAVDMSQRQSRDLIGSPDDINTFETRYSVHKQWVYGLEKYVYTKNGIVTEIQHLPSTHVARPASAGRAFLPA
jgi:hypothetical protein